MKYFFLQLILLSLLKTEMLDENKTYKFASFSHVIPHDDKKEKGGEDSYYNDESVLAVADGVGGWNMRGIDPSKYSKKLTNNIKDLVTNEREKYNKDAKLLLKDAAKNNREIGTSTFVVLTLDNETKLLRTANIGDSGFLILKKNEMNNYIIKYESETQQHSFNFPFQIGTGGDNPDNAVTLDFKVKHEDLIVVYSDGVCDNLYSYEIEKIINDAFQQNITLEKLPEVIANASYERSKISDFLTPFAKGAQEQGMYFIGGKQDDITVVVGLVVTIENNEEENADSPAQSA